MDSASRASRASQSGAAADAIPATAAAGAPPGDPSHRGRAPARPGAGLKWLMRGVAALLGAGLGAAVGHGLAWQTVDPLPDDAAALEIAAQFVGDQPGEISRTGPAGGWRTTPDHWYGHLFGHLNHRSGEVSVQFPADAQSRIAQHEYAVALADQLRNAGWHRVWVDDHYPLVRAHRSGWWVRFGPILAPPPPPESGVDEQDVLGMAVWIRHDTPAAAPLAGAFGALLSAGAAAVLVAAGQRRLRRRPVAVRQTVGVVAGLGLAGLVPGTLATLGLRYLYATDDLPQDPLWIIYSFPVLRPLTLLAAGLLVTAGALTLRPAPASERR